MQGVKQPPEQGTDVRRNREKNKPRARRESGNTGGNGGRGLQGEPGGGGVGVEHLDRFEGVLGEVFADQFELFEDVVGDGDDVATDLVGLEDVEQLAGTGPDEFLGWVRLHHLDGGGHQRHGVAAGVGDSAGKDGDATWGRIGKGGGDIADLREGQKGCHVQFHFGAGKALNERAARFGLAIGDGDLHVDVLAPGGDFVGLAFHFGEVVGKDLEGNGFVGDDFEDVFGESAVVRDSGLAHEGGVGGEAGDVGLAGHFEHAGFVGAIGEDLDSKFGYIWHHASVPLKLPQNNLDRIWEVGRPKVRGAAIGLAVGQVNQDCLTPRSLAGGDIAPAVTHHEAAAQVDVVRSRGLGEQAGLGLSAETVIGGVMKAGVEFCELRE
jgi:hypothetical protein